MNDRVKFVLNGCDIYFVAEAPKDITLEQLLSLCDRIEPDYCACGICTAKKIGLENEDTEILFSYDNVEKTKEFVSCKIK